VGWRLHSCVARPISPDLPTLRLERSFARQGLALVAGVDEVGRGSWAGPVVAAAVIVPLDDRRVRKRLARVRDSKQLTAREREALLPIILESCLAVALGWSSHHVVDSIGLGAANRRAMERAVARLRPAADALILDAVRLAACPLPQLAVTRGDQRSLSVAAASVVAKVVRDRWMTRWHDRYPDYGFAQHKGYGTRAHRDAIERHGPCPIHRLSFAPLALSY
jgi:ribonuclease HII